jgi:hypothetical protein
VNKAKRHRLVPLAIVLIFAAPMLIAVLLNYSGWQPGATRNHGILVQPPLDVSTTPVTLATGARFDWRDPQWHWNLVALSNGECAAPCQAQLAAVLRMRLTLGRNAERLHLLYLGPALDAAILQRFVPWQAGADEAGALAAYRPAQAGAVALALVNPNGLLILRFDAGFDVAQVREDLVKVVH